MDNLQARLEALEQRSATSERRLRDWRGVSALAVAAAICLMPLRAESQVRDHHTARVRDHRKPQVRDQGQPQVRDHRGEPSPYPTEARPEPRPENPGTRRGFIWVRGHWERRTDQWEWIPGHWERERAGGR